VQPQSKWTGPLLVELIAWGRKWAGRPDMPYILFGHSAGAQLLSRVSAYTPPLDAVRIVIANPSAHVWPSLEEAVPYGFDGIFDAPTREARLRAYLALPITIYLGADDTGTKLLVDDAPAVRQGANRYERGRNVYRAASDLSRKRSWRFGWRLVEVPDTGHSARRMLDAAEAVEALGLRAREPAQR
jgi:alpha-beta hydrolase superfamily lysophospholipase